MFDNFFNILNICYLLSGEARDEEGLENAEFNGLFIRLKKINKTQTKISPQVKQSK